MGDANILLVKAGEAAPEVRLAAGDYDRWFFRALGRRLPVVRPYLGEALPDARKLAAVLVTGSPESVTAEAGWMRSAAGWLLGAGERGVPVLGVCFGHQLLAWALGGSVARSPRGREIGTVEVRLTAAARKDPLFSGLPPRLQVQATHEDEVISLPRGAEVFAANHSCAVQAFALGPFRGVQFHPEMPPEAMAAVIRARASRIDSAAVARGARAGERVPQLLAGVRPTPHGPLLLRGFLDRIAGL